MPKLVIQKARPETVRIESALAKSANTKTAITKSSMQLSLLILYGLNVVKSHWKIITILLLVAIAYLSLCPPGEYKEPAFPGIDKLKHLIAYACLVMPLFIAQERYWRHNVLGLLVFSGLIELVQPYFQRTTDFADLIANGVGLLLGCCITHALLHWSKFNDPKKLYRLFL